MKKLFPILILTIAALVSCYDDDNIAVNNKIKSFIEQKYEGAIIIHAEREWNKVTEVEISHDGRQKDVFFDRKDNWTYTTWDVTPNEVPEVAINAVQSSYPSYTIDGIDYIERPTGDYYKFELEKGEWDIVVNATADGIIVD